MSTHEIIADKIVLWMFPGDDYVNTVHPRVHNGRGWNMTYLLAYLPTEYRCVNSVCIVPYTGHVSQHKPVIYLSGVPKTSSIVFDLNIHTDEFSDRINYAVVVTTTTAVVVLVGRRRR